MLHRPTMPEAERHALERISAESDARGFAKGALEPIRQRTTPFMALPRSRRAMPEKMRLIA